MAALINIICHQIQNLTYVGSASRDLLKNRTVLEIVNSKSDLVEGIKFSILLSCLLFKDFLAYQISISLW